MLIKAEVIYSRAVSDFLFAFCCDIRSNGTIDSMFNRTTSFLFDKI